MDTSIRRCSSLGTALIVLAAAVAPTLGGPLHNDFDIPTQGSQTPFTVSTVSGPPAAIQDAADDFLRVLYQNGGERKFVAFDRTETGTGFNKIKADFDVRAVRTASGGSFGDGFSFALLNTAHYGTTGGAPTGDSDPERWQLPGGQSISLSFDSYPGGYDGAKTVTVYYDGSHIGGDTDSAVDYSHGNEGGAPEDLGFDHAQAIVEFVPVVNRADVSLYLGGDTTEGSGTLVMQRSIPAVGPYENRAAFGARTGGATNWLDLDNVNVEYSTVALEPTGTIDFRVECDDRNTVYSPVADDTTVGTAVTGHNWTNTGTIQMPFDDPQFLHIHGQEFSGGQWMAAHFIAPAGFQFAETGSRFLTTNSEDEKQPGQALWSASLDVPWDDPAYVPWDPTASPNPPTDHGGAGSNFPPGTRRIWSQSPGNDQDVYFSTQATLQETPAIEIAGTPLSTVDTDPGLTARIVESTTSIRTLSAADGRFGVGPGDGGHYASDVRAIERADIHAGSGGAYDQHVGYLAPSYRDGGADSQEYAVTLAGYVYAPTDDYVRSFAVGSDDGYRLTIGDTVVGEYPFGGGIPSQHDTFPVLFPTQGYYPITIEWWQGDGGGGLEVSSREGEWRTFDWTSDTFDLLGTELDYDIYQRPDGVPSPGDFGPESAGGALVPGAPAAPGDGLRVQVHHHGDTSIRSVTAAKAWLKDHPDAGTIVVSNEFDYRDNQNGSGGEFPINAEIPGGTGGDDNNYATKVSGLMYLTEGDHAFAIGSDDGFELRVGDRVIGNFDGGRGDPGGRGNFCYVHIPEDGLYPVELTHYEGSGGSSLEFSYRPSPGLLASSRNPNAAGFSVNFGDLVYSVEPFAEMRTGPQNQLQARAAAQAPGLGQTVPPEYWLVERRVTGIMPGLWAQYYTRSGDNPGTLMGEQPVLTESGEVFRFGDNYAYGPWGDLENNFVVRWTGFLNVPETGTYDFRMDTDDRSWIFIDTDGDGVPDPAPGNNNWTVIWDDVDLDAGPVAVEFRGLEYGGGENSRLRWDPPGPTGLVDIGSEYFTFDADYWEFLTEGDFQVGDLLNFADVPDMQFPYGHTEELRLSVMLAGQWASFADEITFVPEPATMALLAMGLGALARRRRRRA
ncbi:MAG: PA14 domain-containing protein [Candidatus Brocadiia bacterium]